MFILCECLKYFQFKPPLGNILSLFSLNFLAFQNYLLLLTSSWVIVCRRAICPFKLWQFFEDWDFLGVPWLLLIVTAVSLGLLVLRSVSVHWQNIRIWKESLCVLCFGFVLVWFFNLYFLIKNCWKCGTNVTCPFLVWSLWITFYFDFLLTECCPN